MSIQIVTLNAELGQTWNDDEHRYSYRVVLKFGDVQIDAWPVPEADRDRVDFYGQNERDQYVQEFVAEKLAQLFVVAGESS